MIIPHSRYPAQLLCIAGKNSILNVTYHDMVANDGILTFIREFFSFQPGNGSQFNIRDVVHSGAAITIGKES